MSGRDFGSAAASRLCYSDESSRQSFGSFGFVSASRFSFEAEVWEHDGTAAWYFVSLPESEADDIEAEFGHRAGGFGSVKVEVTIGGTTWATSLFPDNKRATYVLPLKKAVRTAEAISAGSVVTVHLTVHQLTTARWEEPGCCAVVRQGVT